MTLREKRIGISKRLGLPRDDDGFTLVEIAVAMGIFAVCMAVAAQTLLTFSFAMDAQKEKTEAMAHCRAVYSQIRMDRDASAVPFPNQIIDVWPQGAAVADADLLTLPNEAIIVTYDNVTDNPLRVTVTSTWNDRMGRPIQVALSSLLTGQNR